MTKLIRIGNNARKMIVQIFALRFNLPLLITSAATPTVNARPEPRRLLCRTPRRANKKIFAICPLGLGRGTSLLIWIVFQLYGYSASKCRAGSAAILRSAAVTTMP